MNTIQKLSISTFALFIIMSSCKKDEVIVKEAVKTETVKDLAADPTSVSTSGQPTSTGKYTFYSFKNGIIANTDSATLKWDVAFKATTILTNGGTSGIGQGGASVLSGIFDEVKTIPSTSTFVQDSKTAYAIPTGSGKGWYNYDGANNLISPIAGKVLLIKTADGKYAKMEILSYYKGSPVSPTSSSVSRYFTFRYVYQPDGTQLFN
ncbi:heme-binding HmuY-like protein [Arcicella aurantiaca]|uniref:Heme-binding HmuY-like protein n=1 Tax=Arcicella aurantiaca TaxID=591202 RepID=A0A316DBE5_9BACT|nr:HmuY family protein [Arcicella aurantiaca]PWK15058.1 heme-binding HmuY-like protein [Arcicella aurantiaca]